MADHIITNGINSSGLELHGSDNLRVSSGGTATETYLFDDTKMYIYNGGQAEFTAVNGGNVSMLLSGGTATATTISRGRMYVYDKGIANNTSVTYGDIYLYSGATINSTTLEDDIYFSGAATANNTTIQNNGYMVVCSGGTANSTIINSGGSLHVSSSGILSNTTINSGGRLSAYGSGILSNTTINSGGYVYMTSATAKDTVVRSGGEFSVGGGYYSGTTATNIQAESGAKLSFDVYSNTYIQGEYEGAAFLIKDGVVSGYTIHSGGELAIYDSCTASKTTINAGGALCVSSATANDVTINAGGALRVTSGTATNVIENGGYVSSFNDAENITYTKNTFTDVILNRNAATAHSGTTAVKTVINSGGGLYVYTGGSANSTTINSSGSLNVYSGGTADNTSITSSGCLYVESGGTANSTVVSSGGYLNVDSGGTANSNTIKNGYLYVDGTVSNTAVSSGGYFNVWGGGTANKTTIFSGGSGSVYNGTLNSTTVHSGGNLGLGGHVKIAGSLQIEAGAKVKETTIDFTLDLVVKDRTTEDEYLINDLTSINGTPEVSITVGANQAAGVYKLAQGAAGFNKTVSVYVSTSEIGSFTVNGEFSYNSKTYTLLQQDGNLTLQITGGSPDIPNPDDPNPDIPDDPNPDIPDNPNPDIPDDPNPDIPDDPNPDIPDDPNPDDPNPDNPNPDIPDDPTPDEPVPPYNPPESPTISATGNVWIYSSGTLIDRADSMASQTITGGGNNSMYVSSGGTAEDTDVTSKGHLYVKAGGIANRTEVSSNGTMILYTGAAVSATKVSSNSWLYISGGKAVETTLEETSYLHVKSTGAAENTTVASTGKMYVSSGAMAGNTVVTGGELTLSAGAIHYGTLQIDAAATVIAETGVILDFTVAGRTAEDGYLINDLTLLHGTPTYTITVSADQAAGEYKLAQGAKALSGTLAIGELLLDYGTITINGENLICNDKSFLLKSDKDGNLTLSVSDDITAPDAPTAELSTTDATNLDVTITATFSDDSVIKQYKIGNGEWLDYNKELTISENTTVYFRAKDAAGNSSSKEIIIDNIDKEAPDAPAVQLSTTSATNQDVTITATFSDDSVIKQYKIGNGEWLDYESELTISENATVYFLAKDAAGNSSSKAIIIDNIDKEVPDVPTAVLNTDAPTNKDVVVTISYAPNCLKLYQIGTTEGEWLNYIIPITVTDNTTVYFKAQDIAGNVSDTGEIVISNIDRIAPAEPVAVLDTTKPTGAAVTVTVTYSEDSNIKQYRIGNSRTWNNYTEAFTVTENTTVYFRAIDTAGNVSNNQITIDNIVPGEPGEIVMSPRTDLLSNGVSQIVAWDASQGKVGYVAVNGEAAPQWTGIWEWTDEVDLGEGNKVAEKDLWRVAGVGNFKGTKVDYDGVLLYNGIGNTFAAWTDLKDPSYGYVELCHVEGNFQTQCLTNLDGDEYDDILIYDERGSFGVVTGGTEWHSIWNAPEGNVQQLIGAGKFGAADGNDSLLVKKTDEDAYFLWQNNDSTFATWNWSQTYIGSLDNDWSVAAIGDFQGDGTDDIIMWQKSTGYMYAWEDGKSNDQRWVGELTAADWEVAAVGDYNGDGKEDLLLRELTTGWGGIGYWASGDANNWADLNARIETDMESKFAVIA